jgi:hypothetical protein
MILLDEKDVIFVGRKSPGYKIGHFGRMLMANRMILLDEKDVIAVTWCARLSHFFQIDFA